MVRVHVWLKCKDGMSPEAFQEYWLGTHAPIARDGYANLKGYVVNVVTRVPEGQDAAYDGVAELAWETREDFSADMKSDAAQRVTRDLSNFTRSSGLLFIDQSIVK
jgi:uncharacterized protein (TIGR02118 family)